MTPKQQQALSYALSHPLHGEERMAKFFGWTRRMAAVRLRKLRTQNLIPPYQKGIPMHSAEKSALQFLRNAKPSLLPPTIRELANFAGCSAHTMQKAVERLEEAGKIVRPRKGRSSRNIYLRGKRS